MRLRAFLPILVLLAAECRAAVYFVDPTLGVDSRPKKQARVPYFPWRHIQVAIDSAAIGDTIHIAGGTYEERFAISKRLTFLGESGPVTIIQYPSSATGYAGPMVSILPGVDGVYMSELTIDGDRSPGRGATTGIQCGVGVDALTLQNVTIRNCVGLGLATTSDGSPDGSVNDNFLLLNCTFANIRGRRPGNLVSCGLYGDHLSHALLSHCEFSNCEQGMWIGASAWPDTSAGTGNAIVASVFEDLTQNAVVVAGASHSRFDSLIIRRCGTFPSPDSAGPAAYPGALCFRGKATDNLVTRSVVRECGGRVNAETFYTNPPASLEGPGYNGWPGVMLAGDAGVTISGCTVFGNTFGGVFVSGGGSYAVTDDYIYANGELNDAGMDYGLSAPSAFVSAGGCWWGNDAGPGSDGPGPRNTVVGPNISFTGGTGGNTVRSGFDLRFNPSRLIFNLVHVGTYLDLSCTFFNAGRGPAFTTAPYIAGSPDQYTVLSPTAAQILQPGDSVTVNVRFAPTQLGLIYSRVILATDTTVTDLGPLLMGFGGLPVLTTSDTLFFDTLAPGRCAERAFTVHNTGTELLSIDSADVVGLNGAEFSLADPLPQLLSPDQRAVLRVRYCPQGIGLKTARLVFHGNTQPTNTFVELRAVSATVSRLRPSPDTIALGLRRVGSTADTTVIVRNTASMDMSLDSVSFSGDNAGEYTLRTALPLTIAPGRTALVSFRYAPTSRGIKHVSLIGTAGDGTIFTTAITGGGGVYEVSRSVDTLFRGASVSVGDQRMECLTLRNTGDFAVGVFLAQLSGRNNDQYTLLPMLGGILAPGQSDTLCARFHPVRTGAAPAVVYLQYTESSMGLDSIFLDGTATPTAVAEALLPGATSLAVIPNPARAEARVVLGGLDAGSRARISLVDVTGRIVVDQQDLRAGEHGAAATRIDASSLPAGIYLLRAMSGSRVWTAEVAVVK